jgi:hypothetical protein
MVKFLRLKIEIKKTIPLLWQPTEKRERRPLAALSLCVRLVRVSAAARFFYARRSDAKTHNGACRAKLFRRRLDLHAV